MLLFDREKCVNIALMSKNEYVRLAVYDLINDFKRITESDIVPEIIEKPSDWCIIIEECEDSAEPLEDESFSIRTCGNNVIIKGAGYLGTMWGIYTFSEKYLGVDPCYLFNDMAIQKKDKLEIPEIDILDKPETFGLRGAFLNDEDFLTGWKDGGGIRYIDYKFYTLTLAEEVIERVVETILRLKLNLLIPASFLNIDNPHEKLLVDVAAKRGIYVTQHHIEPLGVSFSTFENYCKKYGKQGKFSYIENPELMEEVWTEYASKWAQYDKVVWQIGLRGAKDRPIWEENIPTDEELQKAGEFISMAYRKQRDIVMRVTDGKAKYFTSTLWMEGSVLAEKGYLEFPQNTIIIFADAGPNQMYGKEFYSVPRNDGIKYGIYYHLQYYGCGPHYAPQTGLDKLEYNIRIAYENGDNAYSILNVSNIREFVFEMKAYSQMLWNIEKFSKAAYLDEYCGDFGEFSGRVKETVVKYYELLPEIDPVYLKRHLSKYFNYFEEKVVGIKNFVVKEGMLLSVGTQIAERFHRELDYRLYKEFYDALLIAIPEYNALCKEIESYKDSLDARLKKHIEAKWYLYTKTLLSIYTWYVNLYEAKAHCDLMESELMKEKLNNACGALEEYLQMRKCAEYGDFENWYRGDVKRDVAGVLKGTRLLLGQTIKWR